MAGHFDLSEAFVRIRPDTGGFRTETMAELKAAMAGVSPTVPVTADTDLAKRKVAGLVTELALAAKKATAFRLIADDAQAQAAIARIYGQLARLDKTVSNPKLTLEGAVRAAGQLAGIESQLGKLAATVATAHVGIDEGDTQRRLALLITQLTALETRAGNIRLGLSDPGALARLAELRAALAKLTASAFNVDVGTGGAGLAAAEAEYAKLARDIEALIPATTAASRGFRGLWGVLGAKIPLFGGVAAVGGLHLLVDGIAEIAAVAAPAAIALGAFGAAAVPTLQDVYTREKNLYTVSQALGTQMPGLSGGFAKMAAAVRPEVYSLMGEALNTINAKGGTFQQLATGAGAVLDQLGARAELALGSKGLSGFLQAGVHDLSVIGNIGGNVLGTLGNLLKTLPGYAEALAHALLDVTGGLEHITASGAVQGIIHAGLAFHGLFLYSGLAATAVTLLKGPLTTLGSQLTTAALSAGAFVENIVKTEGASGKLSAAFGFLTKVPIWGWVAVGVAALTGLAVVLSRTKDATAQWITTLQQGISSQLTIPATIAKTAQALAEIQAKLASGTQDWASAAKAGRYAAQDLLVSHHELVTAAGQTSAQLTGERSRLQELTTSFGSLGKALGIAAALHINLVRDFQAGGTVWKDDIKAMQGYTAAVAQLAGYSGGRAVAAQNALTFATDQQRQAIQQVTQAEDTYLNTVIGSEQGLSSFLTSLKQTGLHAYSASAGFQALTKEAQKTSDFWTTLLPKSQSLIDSLNAQEVSTGQLRKAVATVAAEDLIYAGHNQTMQAGIVALINNALGPGTVSFRDLRTWIDHNSTSLQGLNKIVGTATINEALLTSAMQGQGKEIADHLVGEINQGILAYDGVDQAARNYGQTVAEFGKQSDQARAARKRLIDDLIASGQAAHDTKKQIGELISKVLGIPPKRAIKIVEEGLGHFSISGAIAAQQRRSILHHASHFILGAAGMKVTGGTPGQDSVPALLMPGEVVVPKHMVKAGAVDHLKGKIPGFAAGGFVGDYSGSFANMANLAPGFDKAFQVRFTSAMEAAMTTSMRNAITAAQSAFVSGPSRYGASTQAMRFAQSMLGAYGWGGQWPALYALWQRESGWNPWAVNPTSGAYGIPQALGKGHPFNLGDYANQIRWGLSYIQGRYGSPDAAWAHEVNYGWYDRGGLLPPGLTLAYNATGKPERVVPPSAGAQEIVLRFEPGTEGDLTRALMTTLRKRVRVEGGGSVQSALGTGSYLS